MSARLVTPRHPVLRAACVDALSAGRTVDTFSWRLSDGAEVARIGLRLLVAEADGEARGRTAYRGTCRPKSWWSD